MRVDTTHVWGQEYEEQNSRILPPGTYPAKVTKVEDKVSREGKQYCQVTFVTTAAAGEYAGVTIWDSFFNVSKDDFSLVRLQKAARAMGLTKPIFDTQEFLNRSLSIGVFTDKDIKGGNRNKIKSFSSLAAAASKPPEVVLPSPAPTRAPAPAPARTPAPADELEQEPESTTDPWD